MNTRPNNQKWKRYWLKRYPYCNHCNARVIKASCILDHIKRLGAGGHDKLDNTQLLCLNCDHQKTAIDDFDNQIHQIEVERKKIMNTFDQRIASAQKSKDHMQEIFDENKRKTKRKNWIYRKMIESLPWKVD